MAFDFPTAPAVGDVYTSGGVSYEWNGVGWTASSASSLLADAVGPPQGRLTLSNGTPVMTLSVAAAPTIFYSAYVGDEVPIFDGAAWSMVALPGGQVAADLVDATYSPAPIGVSKCNDWFLFLDAGGVLRLCHGPDWPNDTGRFGDSGIHRVNGLWINSSQIVNGPAPALGTYVGTTRSNAAGTLDWIYGTLASLGGPSFHNVWNTYNRVDVASMVGDTTASAALSALTLIAYPANLRHHFVCGLSEDAFEFSYHGLASAPVSGAAYIAVGFDSENVKSGSTGYVLGTALPTATYKTPALGYHYAVGLVATSPGTAYIYGNTGSPTLVQTGLWFKGRM